MRAGIIGAGFMGEVHASAVRAAGGVVARVAASTPERSAAAADRLGAEAPAAESPRQLLTPTTSTWCTYARPTRCTLRWPTAHWPPASRWCARSRWRPLWRTPARWPTAAAAALVATVPFVYRFYPTVREARARIAAGEAGPLRLLHGTYLQDWLSKR